MLPIIWAMNQQGWHTGVAGAVVDRPDAALHPAAALDLRFGPDGQNPPDEVMERLENDKYYRYCTYVFIPFQYASVVFGAYLFTAVNLSWLGYDGPLSWVGKIGVALSVGVLGGVGINTAHEMGHKKDSLERWLSKITLAQTVLRPLLHRAQPRPPRARRDAGRPAPRPDSARRSGSSCRAACWAACDRRGAGGAADAPAGQSPWNPDLSVQRRAQRLADVGGAVGRADRGVRPGADPVHDHPGGLRLQPAGDRELPRALRAAAAEEPTAAATSAARREHSWNSDHIVTNVFLYHLQRHSDHHANPTRRYQTLRSMDGAPNLPSGYARMIAADLLPAAVAQGDGSPGACALRRRHHPGQRAPARSARRCSPSTAAAGGMAAYRCPVCDYVYDEAKGAPREGFPAGTGWDHIPDDWSCPDCGVREKVDFESDGG